MCNGQKGAPGQGLDGRDGEKGDKGDPGLDGANSPEGEPPGPNCPHGGKAIHAGLDQNANGVLDSDEITNTAYVCHGEPGKTVTTLVSVQPEEPGPNCATGGQAIHTGIDDNADGLLQPAEVDSTSYVCHGEEGLQALIRQQDELPGTNCPYGGKRILTGRDLNHDNYLDDEEVDGSSFVCNGEVGPSGKSSLFNVVAEPAGAHCPSGGQKIEIGLDTDGNGVLSSSEVTNTTYVCHGGQELVRVNQAFGGGVCGRGGGRNRNGCRRQRQRCVGRLRGRSRAVRV